MQEHADKGHYGGYGHIIGVVHENDNGQKLLKQY